MNNAKSYQNINKPKRTLFGKIIKYALIGFNVYYLIWILFLSVKLLIKIQSPINKETLESASIGIPFLIIYIILTWLCGNFILGLLTLFTRPK